ncbi:MAG: choice-of-anchor P family protein [Actinomycetota bacterium]
MKNLASKLVASVFAGLLVAAAPHPAIGDAATKPSGEPRAAAWAIHISFTDAASQVVQVADVSSQAGSNPNATATSYMIGGQGSGTFIATASHPDVGDAKVSYQDPTGSISLKGGFTEAHVTPSNSSARAGIGNGTGNGFAFASQHFTFEQQTQTLTLWAQVNQALVAPPNQLIDQVNPLLSSAGISIPHLQGADPAGLIDIADLANISSSAQTSMSPGFNAAQSSATVGDVKLLGGFIELHNVTVAADSESNSGTDSRTSNVKIGSMTIAGLQVVGGSDGFQVAGNDVIAKTSMQPALDAMMMAAQVAGITFKVNQTDAIGDQRSATAFELQYTTPQGIIEISVGHADASAATASGPIFPVAGGNFTPPPSGPVSAPPVVGGITTPPVLTPPVVTPGTPGVAGHGPTVRSLGPAAARALRTVYLIFLVGGFVGALMYPMLIRRAPQVRRRPLMALKGALQ